MQTNHLISHGTQVRVTEGHDFFGTVGTVWSRGVRFTAGEPRLKFFYRIKTPGGVVLRVFEDFVEEIGR